MSEIPPNPFDLLLERFREIVREEIAVALKQNQNGHAKEWLKAKELAEQYGQPKTWFEERGRAGDIARSKSGRYVLFRRQDVEEYLELHCKKERN